MKALLALVLVLVTRVAVAAPHKVVVLRFDDKAQADELAREKAKATGEVEVSDTTFVDAASAVGCDPNTAPCVEAVRQALGVDEIIVVKHGALMAPAPTPPPGTAPVTPPPEGAHPHRSLAIASFIGGGVAVLAGIVLWIQASDNQNQINTHASSTSAEVQDLVSIEDKASTYANLGNAMMVVGAGLGALGIYFVVKDRHHVAVTPTSNGVAIGGSF